jgi:hypothetical protein
MDEHLQKDAHPPDLNVMQIHNPHHSIYFHMKSLVGGIVNKKVLRNIKNEILTV